MSLVTCVSWVSRCATGLRRQIEAAAKRSVRQLQIALAVGVCLAQPAGAFDGAGAITRIEEDWEIDIGEPDSDSIAPQVFVVTSPTGDLSGSYSVFEINNLSLPDFYGGGLQFQLWQGETDLDECHENNFNALAYEGEQVTFTVRMRVSEGNLIFHVINGQSQTWGTFGEGNQLRFSQPTDLSDLSGYSPDASQYYSRVGFGGNRINKLLLTKVRYYSGSTLVKTDTTVRDATVTNP